ncbi:MAG TPA: glycoside hydrolase family 15 protein, partial [Solirubrobacterales bacterium]|nr:glycoside hydrolase family 15 protein [Solirubrobacterales bacterium]
MRSARAALACLLVVAAGIVLVSGGSDGGPTTPPALPGLPPPFLGTAVSGDGGLTAAVDAYGDVVDLRPGPAGAALIDNPSDRQAAGTVPEDTGIVPRLDGKATWEADRVTQRYLPGTNVVRTVARFGGRRLEMTAAATGRSLTVSVESRPQGTPSLGVDVHGIRCARERRATRLDLICGPAARRPAGGSAGALSRASAKLVATATREARHWLAGSSPPGGGAPSWAQAMYRRSLLTIHALTSRATGAVAAGARDGWAYVWPRDAATAALALAASGHRAEARRVARLLTDLDLSAAARFGESGAPIPGRAAQGDALGWVTVAARTTGIPAPREPFPWRDRADYQESSPGDYLANALAATADVDGPKSPEIEDFS